MPGKTQGRVLHAQERRAHGVARCGLQVGNLVSTGGRLLSLICDTMNRSALFSKSLILTFWLDQSIGWV